MASTLIRQLKNKNVLRAVFEIGQRFKVDILPRHFYSEIPDIRILRNTSQWRAPRSMGGILGDVDAQVDWVDQTTKSYRPCLRQFEIHRMAVEMSGSHEGYGEVEADLLYSFVRSKRPAQIVQIGCGVSTAVCLIAARDEGYTPQITCIEPHPTEFLRAEAKARRLQLIPWKLQDVGPECVSSLKAGDLFFVDSSHTLAPAGEVNIIILETLPSLAPGAYVHFHDIYFPYDYGSAVLSSALFFPHETALLYAFLLMNPQFEIAASLSMLHHMRLDHLLRFFPDMKPRKFDDGLLKEKGHYASSIFLRRLD